MNIYIKQHLCFIKGGGANFFRAFINSESGPPGWPHVWLELLAEFQDIGAEPAQTMPRPNMELEIAISPRWS